MGITRDRQHKRIKSTGKRKQYRKKKKCHMGRQPCLTKLGPRKVKSVRVRGGSHKQRALRLDEGSFSWGSQQITKPSRILGVVYNATSNELVRTNTLVKSAIIQIDATPFKKWYERTYDEKLVGKTSKQSDSEDEEQDDSNTKANIKRDTSDPRKELPTYLKEQFSMGRLYAKINSRPGQVGHIEGQILEGEVYEFYHKKFKSKKKH